jgi:carbon monoxide dehydrogenase subunit G
MRRVSASAEIAVSPDELFAFLADVATLPEWQTGIVSARQTTPGPVRIGSVAHVVRELMGQRLSVNLTVTAYEPGRRLALKSSASGIDVEATLVLVPSAAGTRLTFEMGIKAGNIFMAPMEGMVAGAAERDIADSVARLRERFAAQG